MGRPLHEKHLPNQLSHRGLVIELNSILGATHISLAIFLVAPKHSLGATLHITISVCISVRSVTLCKILKNMWELNSKCLNKIVAQMIERVLHIQGSRVRASVSTFCFKSFFDFLELNMVILVLNVFLSTPPPPKKTPNQKKKKKKKKS